MYLTSLQLRCERASNSATGSCTRCLRKGVACATGVSQRMGRPSLGSKGDSAGSSTPGTDPKRRKSHATSSSSLVSPRTAAPAPRTEPSLSTDTTVVRLDGSPVETHDTPITTSATNQLAAHFDFAFPARDNEPHQENMDMWQNVDMGGTFMDLPDTALTFESTDHLTSASLLSGTVPSLASGPSDPFRFSTQFPLPESDTTPSSRPDDFSSFGYAQSNTTHPSEDIFDTAADSQRPRAESLKKILLKKLSSLSGHLLQDLERMDESATPPLGETHNVGRMLEHSEKYLEILQHIAQPASQSASISDTSPAAASVRYFNLETDDAHPNFDGTSNITLSHLLGDGASLVHPPATTTAKVLDGLLPTAPGTSTEKVISPDIPTMLAILTCYTCLIRLYGRVFSYIQRVLGASPSARQRLLPPLPGLHLCGFKLEQHQNLQLEILARVSLHMLGRIDKMLEEIGTGCVASGVVEQSVAANLLGMIVRQDLNVGLELDEKRKEEGSLKEITASIRRLLDAKLAAL